MGGLDRFREPASGLTRRWWTGIALVVTSTTLIFAFIYNMARYAVLREVRQQAKAVATAVAKAIPPENLEAVRGPEDADSESCRRVAQLLSDIERTNPDVRYAYTMRRAMRSPDPERWDYEFIVDAPSRDLNGDGIISRSEMAEPPGTLYRARHLPAMQRAWNEPAADPYPSPDPPYPDLLSGYAPIRNHRGQTVAIVGVDITAETISRKMALLRVTIFPAWLLFSLLAALFAHLHHRQQQALDGLRVRNAELNARNRILRAANLWLTDPALSSAEALTLARALQQRLLPAKSGPRDHVVVDSFYLGCEMVGGDLYDVFDRDGDHVGMFMADVAGHGVVAAMVAGLLKSAVSSHSAFVGAEALSAVMLDPARLLTDLNRLLLPELPPNAFVTMVYAVFDIPRCALKLASAGHPSPLRLDPSAGKAVALSVPAGPGLGIVPDAAYTNAERPLRVRDRLVFYSDGVTDAINPEGQAFGPERLIRCVETSRDYSPRALTQTITRALAEYRGQQALRDDCSLLVLEIR